ncbi:MAG: DUF115 domain-containing protein [Treponema sp.]|nr:DUF115 domain-containing protein [Treponema sp.]
MSSLVLSSAKNGSTTVSYNNVKLHSFYNPEREADSFIQSQHCSFDPAAIVITEPCLSYTANAIKKRFPNAKCIAIRYCHDFDAYNSVWDTIFYTGPLLATQLYSKLGEEILSATLFISWQPSATVFSAEHNQTWQAIKQAVLKNKTVLSTKAYFAQRWLKNVCHFCTNIDKTALITPGNKPVAVIASGRSLKGSIPYLHKYRADLCIMAVSSAIEVLITNDIIPDLCISTDGGYYAKRHLETLIRTATDIPIALSAESAIPAALYKKQTIIPLSYGDFPEKDFLACIDLPTVHAYRNGTVSGTAIQLALDITSAPVYVCGLDMATAKGYQHTQPNALERNSNRFDTKLQSMMKRLTTSQMATESMDIYRDWFTHHNDLFQNRVYRISDHYPYTNQLGNIQDISWQDFIPIQNSLSPKIIRNNDILSVKTRKHKVKEALGNLWQSEQWLQNAFPADIIALHRLLLQEQKDDALASLLSKNNELYNTLLRYVE